VQADCRDHIVRGCQGASGPKQNRGLEAAIEMIERVQHEVDARGLASRVLGRTQKRHVGTPFTGYLCVDLVVG
jgi:hypothetical protein